MSNTPSGETVEEILIHAYHAGSMAQPGKTIHSATVSEWSHSLRQAIEGMVAEIIGNPLPMSELKPHAMSDAAAKKMRQGSELTVDAQLERAEAEINKLFGKE